MSGTFEFTISKLAANEKKGRDSPASFFLFIQREEQFC